MRETETAKEQAADTLRLEAFSDGVFAIAITLLILEIRLPPLPPGERAPHLTDQLIGILPACAVYILSFINIGIYWANHNHIFKLYKRTDHVFNLLNVLFLMCVSFVPFPTLVLGQYVTNPLERKSAIIFYGLGLFLPAFTWSLSWLYGSIGYRLIDKDLEPRYVRFCTWQFILSDFVYLIAMLVTEWHASIGLAITAGFTFLYLLPPVRPLYKPSPAHSPSRPMSRK